MTVREPLYYDTSSGVDEPILQAMNSSQINQIREAFKNLYIQSPSVALTVVGSGGNLGSMIDSRLVAGAMSVGTSAFPDETVTQEPQIQQVSISRIQQNISTASEPVNSYNRRYPVYYAQDDDGNDIIKSMTLQDMYDTFIADPASPGTFYKLDPSEIYTISSNISETGYDEVSGSGTPIFTDTRANPAGYNTSEIPETEDATTTTTVQNYYLHRKRASTPSFSYKPIQLSQLGEQLRTLSEAEWNVIFKEVIQYFVANIPNYRVRYSINGTGITCGTTMTDTRLEGSGNYQTRLAGDDDYRAQEFPDGSNVIIGTYTLNVRQE